MDGTSTLPSVPFSIREKTKACFNKQGIISANPLFLEQSQFAPPGRAGYSTGQKAHDTTSEELHAEEAYLKARHA